MTEIKRYGSGLSGQIIETPQGSFVDYDDHAAIVAAKDARIKALEVMSVANVTLGSVVSDLIKNNNALQEQVRAWENENAAMRSAINQTIGWQESVDPSNGESVRMLVGLITPNTDAALREIRAFTLESLAGVAETMLVKFSNQGASAITEAIGWDMIKREAERSAARIRAGDQP